MGPVVGEVGAQELPGFIHTNILDVFRGDWFPMLVNCTLSHNDDVETRTTSPGLVKHREKSGQWKEPVDGKGSIRGTG